MKKIILLLFVNITLFGQTVKVQENTSVKIAKRPFVYGQVPSEFDTINYDSNVKTAINHLNYIRTNLRQFEDSVKKNNLYKHMDVSNFPNTTHKLIYDENLCTEAMNRAICNTKLYFSKYNSAHIFHNNGILEAVGIHKEISSPYYYNKFDLELAIKELIEGLIEDFPPYVVGHRNALLTNDTNYTRIGIGYYYETNFIDNKYHIKLMVYVLIATEKAMLVEKNFGANVKEYTSKMTTYTPISKK